jgi:hypothetical protein
MTYPLFSRVALSVDLPEYNLKSGDVATIVDTHTASGKRGFSLEVFNAKGATIAVVVADETQIKPLQEDEILHIRHIDKIAA